MWAAAGLVIAAATVWWLMNPRASTTARTEMAAASHEGEFVAASR